VQLRFLAVAAVGGLTAFGCDAGNVASPSPPGATTAVVRIVFLGATLRRSDLPPSAQACVNGVGATHAHPSWRSFASVPLQPVPPDRYEIVFSDVPVSVRVSFRINDQNSCDENSTGAVTRNVLVNEVRVIQNATTQEAAMSQDSPSRSRRMERSASSGFAGCSRRAVYGQENPGVLNRAFLSVRGVRTDIEGSEQALRVRGRHRRRHIMQRRTPMP
jgi:hypothetical protein